MFPSLAFNRRILRQRKAKQSIALVVTLALLVVISLLVVAFVTAMRLDRSATASYSQSLKADQIARGAIQLVVAQLQLEMSKDNLPDATYAGKPLYTNVMPVSSGLPPSLVQQTNIAPQRVGNNSAMTNLVKISTNAAPFTGTKASGKLLACGINSTVPSLNGRSVSAARWNQAYLGTFPADNISTPYWIIMSRGGPTNAAALSFGPATVGSLNNPTPGNGNYAVGRVAYAVYDEGGLLNIAVAGYPTAAANSAVAKGATAWADLSQIPGISDPNSLVLWRNAVSSANYASYLTNYAETNGYGKVYPGDTTFLSRTDLIGYALANPAILNTNALPYLTTFSWEQNTPYWKPTTLPSGAPNYAKLANTLSSTNVFLPLVRVLSPGGWTRRDGTTAVTGDSLIKQRFPLSKISLITPSATGDTTSPIYQYFGLTRASASSPWVYRSGASTINSLKTVATLGREPDFFELLYAAILTGSTGEAISNTDAATYTSNTAYLSNGPAVAGPDQSPMLQILQIGADIIDQATTDNYPTIISFSSGTYQVQGIKDLPYPHTFLLKILGYNSGGQMTNLMTGYPPGSAWISSNTINAEVGISMWNPHQLNPNTTNLAGPTNFQVTVNPGNQWAFASVGVNQPAYPNGPTTYPNLGAISGYSIPFVVPNPMDGNADYRSSPRVIRQDGSVGQGPTNILDFPILAANPTLPRAIGYKMIAPGAYTGPLYTNTAASIANSPFSYYVTIQNTVFSFQYKDATGVMQTYATMCGPTNLPKFAIWNSNNENQMQSPVPSNSKNMYDYSTFTRPDNTDGLAYLKSDPRTYRFGVSYGNVPFIGASSALGAFTNSYDTFPIGDYPLIPATAPTTTNYFYTYAQSPGGADQACRLDLFSQNTAANLNPAPYTYKPYTDPDGTMRPGDCYLSPTNQPMSLMPAQVANRPIILSRPFRSVGELGYTFRDAPWKSIDFSSASSGDGGLLDAFTVTDAPLIAGKVDLNTKHPEVLQALIAGANSQEVSQTNLPQLTAPTAPATNTASVASAIATALVQSTTTLPMTSLADLPGRLPAVNSSLATPYASKMQLEAITRALADTTTTRTWNVMIDVVAQAGEYPPTATSLDQFVVEGERHYWMHVAIDRFTGQVIAKQVEVPSE